MLPLFGRPLPACWPGGPGRCCSARPGVVVTMVLFAAERTGTGAGRRSARSRSPPACCISALGLVLRVLAIALPGVLVFATTDPTDLADALVQNAKAPARFAIGALAAFRLVPLLGQEWQMLDAGPPGPRRRRRPQPGRAGCGCSPRPRSRCWSARSGAAPGWRWRWTPAASTPACRARSPAGSVFGPADAALIAGAAVLAARGAGDQRRRRPLPPHPRLGRGPAPLPVPASPAPRQHG